MNSEFAILSPEKVVLTYQIASIGNRIRAHLLDLLLAGVLVIGELLTTVWLNGQGFFVLAGLIQPLYLPTVVLYFVLFEILWNGRTPGKRSVGLRVRMADGTPITPFAAIGRNLLRFADFLPMFYLGGFVCIITTRKSQRFGDLAAGTCVFYEKRAVANFQVLPPLVGLHAFENSVGDLRGMTQAEYDALRRLCDRFPQLPDPVQQNMLQEVWTPIARRLAVPLIPNVHPIFLAEAVVMKYARANNLL